VCFNDLTPDSGIPTETANGRRGWGANFQIEFLSPNMGAEVDASKWDGVAFWARLGPGPTHESIGITVGDAFTAGETYLDPDTNEPTSCSDTALSDAAKCDAYGVAVTLLPQWTFYRVSWEMLKQKGYGRPGPTSGLDTSRLRRIQVQAATGDWDFYLDDLSFYRSRP
jgi:hypothetical protein